MELAAEEAAAPHRGVEGDAVVRHGRHAGPVRRLCHFSAEGIQLAYQLAESQFIEDGVNRIVLATDGDFNVGIDDIKVQLEKQDNCEILEVNITLPEQPK